VSAKNAPAAEPAAELRRWPQRYVEDFPLDKLKEFPGNPKDHDVGAIHESMRENGIVDVIYVQEWPKTPKYILAGHGRKKTLLAAGVTRVNCVFVQIPPDAARRYVVASNRTAEAGGWNDDLLTEYLRRQAETEQLLGTGFDGDDLDEMLRASAPPDAFPEVGQDIETEHKCPRCGYEWSGKAAPGTANVKDE
jgi:ParB-like chromosome segregation protein Spo0J